MTIHSCLRSRAGAACLLAGGALLALAIVLRNNHETQSKDVSAKASKKTPSKQALESLTIDAQIIQDAEAGFSFGASTRDEIGVASSPGKKDAEDTTATYKKVPGPVSVSNENANEVAISLPKSNFTFEISSNAAFEGFFKPALNIPCFSMAHSPAETSFYIPKMGVFEGSARWGKYNATTSQYCCAGGIEERPFDLVGMERPRSDSGYSSQGSRGLSPESPTQPSLNEIFASADFIDPQATVYEDERVTAADSKEFGAELENSIGEEVTESETRVDLAEHLEVAKEKASHKKRKNKGRKKKANKIIGETPKAVTTNEMISKGSDKLEVDKTVAKGKGKCRKGKQTWASKTRNMGSGLVEPVKTQS